ncbi:MAG: PDZ domain-containing protein [Acidobacteriota bacterium]
MIPTIRSIVPCLVVVWLGAGLVSVAVAESAPADRGFLGFRFELEPFEAPLTEMVVTGLYPGGPAERAGLRVGDRVQRLNGVAFRFTTVAQARSAFDWVVVGEPVDVTVERSDEAGSKTSELRLTPDPLPAAVFDYEDRARSQAAMRDAILALRQGARRGGALLEIERRSVDELVLRIDPGAAAEERLDPSVLGLPLFARVAPQIIALKTGERLALDLVVDGERLVVRPRVRSDASVEH